MGAKLSKVKQKKKSGFLVYINRVRYKLIGAYLVPVALIILLGILSYSKSSKGIIHSYETSSLTTLEMMANFFKLGFEGVQGKATRLIPMTAFENTILELTKERRQRSLSNFVSCKIILFPIP